MKTLRIILWDQLSSSISSLKGCDKNNDIVLLFELKEDATIVKHHKKKLILLFSAMRHFAQELSHDGYDVEYIKLDDPQNSGSLSVETERAIRRYKADHVVITHPSDYHQYIEVSQWQNKFSANIEIKSDDRFLCTPKEFAAWAGNRKNLRMEYFYREMRKKYNILMSGSEPEGGKWNYDANNRKPPKEGLKAPPPYRQNIDEITKEITKIVNENFSDHFGDIENFHFAVTRKQALEALQSFIEQRLINFGDYQDAMLEGEPWMYHSHISFYLNCGLLLPLECVRAAESAYVQNLAPLNAVEGFIRQIIGWREYVRGIYWLKMPNYREENFFKAKRDLPDFYWTGETKLNCLKQCVKETKENAYAHHIQRLMVLGNFALIAAIDPKQVNEWFWIVYADAYEWVELPNVSGMILFADGGYLASKPYAAGGSYINKMSNYCQNCSYKVSKKNGEDACPFNYLYWDFLARNRNFLGNNQRISMMYKTYDRMSEEKKQAITEDSSRFLEAIYLAH